MLRAHEPPRPELVVVEAAHASARNAGGFDPHLWLGSELDKNTRQGDRLRAVGFAWGLGRVKAAKGVGKIDAVEPANTSGSCFTGKEEDVEVGLQYFGKRFLNPLLNRWVSPDPLAVHAPINTSLNLYAYVDGTVSPTV